MDVHGLDADTARSGEAVPNELGATHESSAEAVDGLIHTDGIVAEDPAAGLDIDLLTWLEDFFEDVAVAVEPDDTFGLGSGEAIDEEAGATEEHVGDAFDTLPAVVEVACGGEELVLADEDGLAGMEVEAEDLTSAVAREGDFAGALGFGDVHGHAGDHTLERTFAAHADLELWIFPEENVVLEENIEVAVKVEVKDGDEGALDAILDARDRAIVFGGEELR